MLCSKCGNQFVDTAKFCPHCGAAKSHAAVVPPTPAAEPPPMPGRHDKPVEPPPAAGAPPPKNTAEEPEIVPPPPDSGVTINFRANPQGRMESAPAASAAASADPSAPGATASAASSGFDAVAGQDCVLPAQGPVWGFRRQTSALADKLVHGLSAQNQGQTQPIMECAARLIRGALLHTEIYRTVASRAALTVEAAWVAAVLVVISTVGLNVGNLFGYSSSILIKAMVLRVIGWAASVFAIHYVAKAWQKVDLPPIAWFRAMVYGQAVLLLAIVPVLGILPAAWSAICTVAAFQDVSGKDLVTGIGLVVTAGVANAVAVSVLASFWT